MPIELNRYTRGRWMKAADLDGQTPTLTISRVAENTFEQNETKVVLAFRETEQGLVLNKTRLVALMSAFGPNTDAWVGRRVQLGSAPTFNGKATVLLTPIMTPAPSVPDVVFQ